MFMVLQNFNRLDQSFRSCFVAVLRIADGVEGYDC